MEPEDAPAEFHQSIGDVERQIGFLRHKIEVFLRHEPHDPSIVAASLVGAHNHLARVHGFSPAQWALGRDLQASGHANPGPGEDVAIGTMHTSGTDLHSSMMLRKRAEQAFREQREKDLASRALNARTRSNEVFTPGDLIYYRRLKEPADQAANSIVDKSRMRIGRFYGPGRVLASETKVEPDGRKASHMIWIISQGRLKKCHSSQLRHATEQERLISKAFEQQSMPWTLSALTRLLDKGEYDDETIPPPAERKRGRSRTPGRAASRGRFPMHEDSELPVPEPQLPPPDDESEPELIPVPPPTTSRSRSPVPPTQDYEEPPVPAQSLVVEDLLHDVNYLPSFSGSQWTARPRKGNRRMRRGLQQTALDKEEAEQSVFSVVIDAPDSEEGWKRIVKDPRKFVSKSIQKGVEVNWQKLSPEQQKAMAEAKALEVDQWISTQACEAVRHVVPDSQLLRMRWVLTFKSAGSDTANAGKMKAKARIVILGFSDPHLLEVETASPAMSRLSRQLFLQMCSTRRWRAMKADVKSAFLQAESPQRDRQVYARPIAELAEAMNLTPQDAVQIVRSCYGLCSAPREWYLDVHNTLTRLGAERLVCDPCMWRVCRQDRDKKIVVGIVTSHVDDFLLGGEEADDTWNTFVEAFHAAYKWSPWEATDFSHCGVRVVQHEDFSFSLNHSEFCEDLKQIPVPREERPMSESEMSQVRAVLGSIQWRVYQSGPQHASKLGYLQSLCATRDSSVIPAVNKLVREVHSSKHVSVGIQQLGPCDPSELSLVCWSDAALANRPDLGSTGGYVVAFMTQASIDRGTGRLNLASWHSSKLSRVARSSLAAETQALSDAEQELMFTRLQWRELQGDTINLSKSFESTRKTAGYLVIDAKAVYDTLMKGQIASAGYSLRDKYSALELQALSQHIQEQETTLLWCDSDHQLADGMTKSQKQDCIKKLLLSGVWRLRFDDAFISAKKRRNMLASGE